MRVAEIINQKLTQSLSPTSLEIVDDSHKHAEDTWVFHVHRLHFPVGRLEPHAVSLRKPLLERCFAFLSLGHDDITVVGRLCFSDDHPVAIGNR